MESIIEKNKDTDQNFQSIFCPGVKIRKIRTDADLSPGSLDDLVGEYISDLDAMPDTLLVTCEDWSLAKKLVSQLEFQLRIVVVPLGARYSWALTGNKGVFWSPGA